MTADPTDLPAEKVAALAEALREAEAAPQRAADPSVIIETREWTREAAAIAPLVAGWLGEAEAAAWAGAADDEGDPRCVPTAGQLLRRMANATEDERLAFAEQAIVNSEKGHKCFIENHRGRIGHLERERAELLDRMEAAEATVERVRALADEWERDMPAWRDLIDGPATELRAALAPSTPPDAQNRPLVAREREGGASGHRGDRRAQSGDFEDCAHEWSLGGRPGNYWRECWLCGEFEDLDQQGDT